MLNHPPSTPNEIPGSLREQLDRFRRVLWRRKALEAVAAGVIGMLVSFLLIFGLDRIWQTPGWARLVILLGGILLFAGFAPYWLHRWIWGNRNEGQLARLIARRFPGLGDRILGVIELQGQNESDDSLSPRLRAAAMEVIAAEARKRDFGEALPSPRHRKWGLAAILLMGLVVTAFLVTPKAGLNALKRWLMPFSDTQRYTFTQLESPPVYIAVPYAEAFHVRLRLSKNSEQSPPTASGQYGLQPEVTASLRENTYNFRFPGQQTKGSIIFRAGDARHTLTVEPMQRPSVMGSRAFVEYPAYMGIPSREVDLTSGELTLVEGSSVDFELVMSRSVSSGKYGPAKVSGDLPSGAVFEPVSGALSIAANKARTGKIGVGVVPFELPFSWIDEFQLEGISDFRLRVDAVKDSPPMSYTQGIERQKAILPEETLDFQILCEDDFGLKRVGIEWESIGTPSVGDSRVRGELVLAEGEPEETRIMRPAVFSPAIFGIGPQKVMVRSFSEDALPGRGRSYSDPIIVQVLSRGEHAQLLKTQFDRTIGELEDLSRKELNLLDENSRLNQMDGEELQKDEVRELLAGQEREEDAHAQKMKDLKEKMEETMKGAARNGEIDKETMRKMAESLKALQELSDNDIPKVRDKLGEAKEQSNTPEKSDADVSEAVERQKEVVEKMKKAIEQATDANKRLEASTFVSRFKKAASEEEAIAASLIRDFSVSLGAREREISPSNLLKLNETNRQQGLTAADVRWIQEDLGHYFARTENKALQSILTEMNDSGITVELEEVRSKILAVHTYTATEQAKAAAKKLAEWAETLSGEVDKAGGGSGGGGSANPEDEDFEFMLRVMKMIQTQQDLRARTRVLEQLKRDANSSSQSNR